MVLNKNKLTKYLNPLCSAECVENLDDGRLQCKCGETEIFNWNWEIPNDLPVRMTENNTRVIFFPVYSSGTACLRGTESFKKNLHYYWEIKMLTKLYGTDVMVGVGTERKNLDELRSRFCSALGIDNESWGYSYNGYLQHNSRTTKYTTRFGFGSLIGVHLDMYTGQLEFYLNRKPLGIAFKDLKSRKLYPMISSTAAKSAMKITCAISCSNTLQMKCLQVISHHTEIYKEYKNIPGLDRIFKDKYFWLLANEGEQNPKRKFVASNAPVIEKRRHLSFARHFNL